MKSLPADRGIPHSRKIYWAVVAVVLLIAGTAHSQPYYFYYLDDPNYTGGGYSVDIYRQNLTNGISELILKDAGRITQIFDSPDQNRLILQNRSQVVMVDLNNANKRTVLFERDAWVYQVIFTPMTNRFYVSIGSSDYYQKTIVFDNTTLQPIDTLTELYSYEPICISQDQSKAYISISDSNGLVFRAWDIIANKRLPDRKFTSLGSFAFEPGISDAKNGLDLVEYERPAGYKNQKYVVCNVDQGLVYTPFAFPWIADGYLSADGKHVILNRRIPIITDSAAHEGYDEYPGTVYVFDASTGKLTQRLSLPPGGKILTFTNYPQMFYYYNDSTNQAIAISDTVVTPTNALIDTLISLKHQAVSNGWLRDDRDRDHDIDEMMKGNEWYNKGEFRKFRSWEVGKDWQFDRNWDNGIVEVLDRRLDMAKRVLDRGDSVTARRNLEIFVLEVELLNNLSAKLVKRGEEPIITSQGYLSLKFNAEYLIDRLPEMTKAGSKK